MSKKARNQEKLTKKQTKQDKKIPPKNDFESVAHMFFLTAVGLLLFYPPYFRGLFFAQEILSTHVATSVVFLLWCIYCLRNKEWTFSIGPLDWLVLGYAVVYCLSIIGAVDTRQAIGGALKALNYGLIYFLAAQITLDLKSFRNWLILLYASALGVAFIGIGCATGYVNYPAGFDGKNIASTLQYTNATSVYMAIMAIIGVTLALTSAGFWHQVFYTFTASLLIVVSIGATSKGAWLILILALVLFLIGMPGQYRLKSVYLFIVTLAAGLVSSNLFMLNVQNEKPVWALVSLGTALIIVVLANLLWQGMVRFHQAQGTLKTAVLSISATFLAIATGWIAIGQKIPDAFKNITGELGQLTNLQGASFVYRMEMNADAVNIIKDHPWNGAGAGGWNLLYHQYQSFLYWSTEVHNHLLQVGVETGLLGMLIWLGLFVAVAYYELKMRVTRENEDQAKAVLIWGIGTTILALGAHSLIDFDLSIPSLQILLFALLGLIAAAFRSHPQGASRNFNLKGIIYAGAAVSLFVALLSSSFLIAISGSKLGLSLAQTGDVNSALSQLQKATELDPLNSEYYTRQAQFYTQLYATQYGGKTYQDKWLDMAINQARLAEAKSPNNTKILPELTGVYSFLSYTEDATRLAEKTVTLNPWDINSHNNLGTVYATEAIRYFEKGNIQMANELIGLALTTPDRIEQQAGKLKEDLSPLWQGARLVPNSTTTYILAQAHYYRGDYQTALQELEGLLNQPFAGSNEFKILYAASLYKNGNQAGTDQLVTDFKTAKSEIYSRYLRLIVLPAIAKR